MLIVARHGRTAANAAGRLLGRGDPPLDAVGEQQATAIAAALDADRVVSSPLRRCRETAAALGRPVELDERLIEIDYGELEGMPLGEVPAEWWGAWRGDPAWRPPGGETLDELAARVEAALGDLVGDAATGDVVVVSHVSPIKAAVAWALGVGIDISWRCRVDQASITRLAVGAGGPSLRSFNEVAHLVSVVDAAVPDGTSTPGSG